MVASLKLAPFLLGAIYIIHAVAQPPVVHAPPVEADPRYQPLIEWVEVRTGTKLEPPPVILIMPSNPFKNLIKHEKEYGAEIVGAEVDRHIILDERFSDMNSPTNAALLVHELTHYKQELTGQTFSCNDQREAEAYGNQNKFLIEHHLPLVMPETVIRQLETCE